MLLVRASWVELGVPPEAVAPDLADELKLMAQWLGLDGVRIDPVGDLAAVLAREF
jgi:uncharacterized protein YcaQ